MTVGELIAKLQTFDPALPVMVDGYEGGVDYPAEVAVSDTMGENPSYSDGTWYYGRYDTEVLKPRFCAVLIRRGN